ncbi:MAG TPA: TRAP transporter small permease [Paracoccaceae bacterium]|nr:TRAP transporter small permease [Paracoccaceae bacterium]HMO71942.1 TRAP transporter small permease [Paracoccaceae bacterium]
MAPHDNGPPGAPRRGVQDAVAGAWNLLVDGLGALGTLLIGVLMCLICADVAVRNTMGFSLPMVSEAGALTLVMIVYLQLATTIRHDRLARADLFFAGFRASRPRAGAALAALFDLVACVALGIIAWSTVTILERDFLRGEHIGVTGIATLPTWPFRALILLGLTVSTVQCAISFLRSVRSAAAPQGGRP